MSDVIPPQAPAPPTGVPGDPRLFTDAPTAMLLIDRTPRILAANDLAGHLFGHPAGHLQGRSLLSFLSPISQPAMTPLLTGVFDTPGPHHAQLTLLTRDGAPRSVHIDARRRADGHAHLVLMDVTALTGVHARLLDEGDILRARVHALERQQRRVDGEVQEFIHRTRAHLHAHLTEVQCRLQAHHQALAEGSQEPRALGPVQAALNDAFSLLTSLEAYLQARHLPLRPQRVTLGPVLQQLQQDLQGPLAGRAVEWNVPTLPTVYGDRRALQIILQEYLTNAVRFTRTRAVTRIQVRVEEVDGEVRVGVQDNGIGFSMRQKEEVFELFTRLAPDGGDTGAGIGLAVVRRLCERMGGRAWAEGRSGRGATFWFACPGWPEVGAVKRDEARQIRSRLRS